MSLEIFNTLTRRLETFTPQTPPEVRMYNCGPTVYSSPHIGNFRSFLTGDLLRRHLEQRGYRVLQVMNVTDVGHLTEDDVEAGEDKMEYAARRERLDPWAIARKYEAEFKAALHALRFRPAMAYPRATEHVPEMIEIIAALLEQGYAYRVGGNVYFEQARFPPFGELSGKEIEELEEGARVAVNPEKRDPRDFALWKTDAKHLMQWEAPWGRGFPGWHIECSAMSRKYLGDQLDVHTGGEDNVFPHHECEIAQSEAFTGKRPFARYWLHTRHLLVDGQKMSKSLGNFHTIQDLLDRGWSGLEIRLALLRVHYRMPMNFTLEGLEEARKLIGRVRECRSRLVRIAEGLEATGSDDVAQRLVSSESAFGTALDDDLNVSQALAVLLELVADLNRAKPSRDGARAALALFRRLDEWSGVLGDEPVVERKGGVAWGGAPDDPRQAELLALAAERQVARAAKDFKTADTLRDRIAALGYRLVDTPQGPRVERA